MLKKLFLLTFVIFLQAAPVAPHTADISVALPKRGEIYWVNFDQTRLGTEIYKTRPAVVISSDELNQASMRVIVMPLSSSVKKVRSIEVLVTVDGKPGKVIPDQIRAVDKARLSTKITTLDGAVMELVDAAIKTTLGFV